MNETRWAVAIRSNQYLPDLELPEAICACFRQLGHPASLVQDGDPAGFEADVLLLPTNLSSYPAYCHRLQNCDSRRPVTVLWQMDPLPPENLLPEAEAAGLKATRWGDRFYLHQSAATMSRWKKYCTLFRLREWANKQCSAFGYRKACRLLKSNGGGDFDWQQVRGVMATWRMILDSHKRGWIDHYVVSTNQRWRFLASRGMTAHFIPVGAYEEMGRDPGRPRDIPVGFLGSLKYGRRAAMLKRLDERLKEKGIPLNQVAGGCYGQERREWLNRTRILVNLHNYSWNPAWIRFLLAARCGTLVVSEPMNDEHPMRAGIHYVAATPEEMPEVICNLLDNPDKIRQVVDAAAQLCEYELTLLHAVESLSRFGRTTGPTKPCPT